MCRIREAIAVCTVLMAADQRICRITGFTNSARGWPCPKTIAPKSSKVLELQTSIPDEGQDVASSCNFGNYLTPTICTAVDWDVHGDQGEHQPGGSSKINELMSLDREWHISHSLGQRSSLGDGHQYTLRFCTT